MPSDPLMPADRTDAEALQRALLAHASRLRRERTRRPAAAPWNSLAVLLLSGAAVAALLVFGGTTEPGPGLSEMERRGPPAVKRPAQVRGLKTRGAP